MLIYLFNIQYIDKVQINVLNLKQNFTRQFECGRQLEN